MVRVVATTVIWREVLAVTCGELESFTWSVRRMGDVAATGVPLIKPVDAFRDKPFGSTPEVKLQVYGVVPRVAGKGAGDAAPPAPVGGDEVEMGRVFHS